MVRRINPQRLLIGGLLLLLGLVAARGLCIQGWFRPVRIVSGSMANRLVGEHFAVPCADCGYLFRFGIDSPPPTDQAVCPNCGFEQDGVSPDWRGRGDRVLIDRAAYWLRPPQRFDLVAFRDPRLPARLIVKRVLGLPEELISIRHGDLFVNGKLLRKSLGEFRQVAIPVYDNSQLPQADGTLPARWRTDANHSGWSADESTFVFSPRTSIATSADDWLTYHHWRCYANTHPRSDEAPVSDNYGYNQGESRELRPVRDLLLSCTVHIPPHGELIFRIHDGRNWCAARINITSHQIDVTHADRKLTSVSFASSSSESIQVEFGSIDEQVVLGLDGEERVRQSYDPGDSPFEPIAQPISIGGLDAPFEVSDLLVWRDIHYLDPWGVGQPWSMAEPASSGQFLVLGDNPPLSDDSRRWQQPLLPRDAIIGKVIPLPR